MKWKHPPPIKIYEALGSIGDKRVTFLDEYTAEVFSSSKNKKYTVHYDPPTETISCNDNGSYWLHQLGYPAIAVLMLKKKIAYPKQYANALKDIPWKDLNVAHKNNYGKTIDQVKKILTTRNINLNIFLEEINQIDKQIKHLSLNEPKKRIKPPSGY